MDSINFDNITRSIGLAFNLVEPDSRAEPDGYLDHLDYVFDHSIEASYKILQVMALSVGPETFETFETRTTQSALRDMNYGNFEHILKTVTREIVEDEKNLARSMMRAAQTAKPADILQAVRRLISLGRIPRAQKLADNMPASAMRDRAQISLLRATGHIVEAWAINPLKVDTNARQCLPQIPTTPQLNSASIADHRQHISRLNLGGDSEKVLIYIDSLSDVIRGSQAFAIHISAVLAELPECPERVMDTIRGHAAKASLRVSMWFALSVENLTMSDLSALLEQAVAENMPLTTVSRIATQMVAAIDLTVGLNGSEFAYVDAIQRFRRRKALAAQSILADSFLAYDARADVTITELYPFSKRVLATDEGLISRDNVAAALTARATAFFEDAKSIDSPVILLSTHDRTFGFAAAATLVAGNPFGFSALTVSASDENELKVAVNIAAQQRLAETYPENSFIARKHTKFEDQNRHLLAHLRSAELVSISHDRRQNPAQQKALVPWFFRQHYLPVYPMYLATITNAKVAYIQKWFDADGSLVIDIEQVEIPSGQGNELVRSIWASQRYGRAVRRFHSRNTLSICARMALNYGGVPTVKPVVQLCELNSKTDRQETIFNWIFTGAEFPNDTALSFFDRDCSFTELRQNVLKTASMFMHFINDKPEHFQHPRPFKAQFRVLVIAPKGELIINTLLAGMITGCLICICEDDLSVKVLSRRIADFKPDLIISGAGMWSEVCKSDPKMDRFPTLICDNECGATALAELTDGFAPATHLPRVGVAHPASVSFTSGSSGKSKGVVSPRGVLREASGMDYLAKLKPGDRIHYPARWDSVSILDILSCFRSGVTVVVPPKGIERNPSKYANWIDENRVTYLSATCSLWGSLMRSSTWKAAPPATLKRGTFWGERVSKSLISDVKNAAPDVQLETSFGTTETLYDSFAPIVDLDLDATKASPGGRLIRDTDVLCDMSGRPVSSVDEIGLLHTKGKDVMVGYLNDLWDANAVLPDDVEYSFVHSDFARVNADRQIEILGRNDSVINVAGRRVSLIEIEVSIENVRGVKRCVAFGIETADSAEIVVAVEAENPMFDALKPFIFARVTEDLFANVRPVEIKILADFPILPSGKIDRVALRAHFEVRENQHNAVPSIPDKARNFSDPFWGGIFSWAMSRGLVPNPVMFPDVEVPEFSSIESMELMLLLEQLTGKNMADIRLQQHADSWTELLGSAHV